MRSRVHRVSSTGGPERTLAPKNRYLRLIVSGLIAGLGLAPESLAAQELTPDQVASAFVSAGYEVDAPLAWTWMSPPHTTMRVHDRAAGRVVLVLVYGDAATAAAVRDGTRPLHVPGYGRSSWQQNVALVQASQRDLDRWYASESARLVGMSATPTESQLANEPVSTQVVAPEFLAALVSPLRADF